MKLNEFADYKISETMVQRLSKMSSKKYADRCVNVESFKKYIEQTFINLNKEGEGNILITDEYALFSSCLYTVDDEPIYAYFIQNKRSDRPPWHLDNFYTETQLKAKDINIKQFSEEGKCK